MFLMGNFISLDSPKEFIATSMCTTTKKNKKSNIIVKREKHTEMKYVNKLPSYKHNFSLMATLQSGPPG